MSSNAQEHDAARLQRLQRAAQQDASDAAGPGLANVNGVAGSAREGDVFLAAASRDVYGALHGASLEARVNSRKHFTQR
jgi:L-aminopeptidase/D-esterase-like protein